MRRFAHAMFGFAFSTAAMLGQASFTLPPGCKLPFDAIATKPDPAAKCGNGGCASDDAKKFENLAKNNLCPAASAKTTDLRDFTTFKQLQALNINRTTVGDRSQLRALKPLGEGSLVRLAAFIKEAHISDCDAGKPKTGEAVNCDVRGFALNDIHIPLVQAPTDDECLSVTAEMSPHFRPAAWSQIDLQTPTKNLVRITGPLFFDNSHTPCAKNAKGVITGSPKRVSVWEIHPVHAIEVCKTGTSCDVSKDANWVPYDEWVKLPGIQTTATGKSQRERCGEGVGTPAPCPAPKPHAGP